MSIEAVYHFGSTAWESKPASDVDVGVVVADEAAARDLAANLRTRRPSERVSFAREYGSGRRTERRATHLQTHWILLTKAELATLPIGECVRGGVCLWKR